MISITDLNKLVLENIENYLNLQIYSQKVTAPYFINKIQQFYTELLKKADIPDEKIKEINQMYKNKEIPFGWYRGKGTPEELVQAVYEISEKVGLDFGSASANSIIDFMKLYGIGVDCSGFVYNVLISAFRKLNLEKEFIDNLNWNDKEKVGVNYAGAFVFGGSASTIIKPNQIRPLDLLLAGDSNDYFHIAIFVKKDSELCIAESDITFSPAGVHLNKCKVVGEKIYANGIERFSRSNKEIRRLKICGQTPQQLLA